MIMKKIILIALMGLCACNDLVDLNIDNIAKDKYYTTDNISHNFQDFYGKWKLISIFGGFSGQGYKPNFDFLEIKPFGIYGIIKGDSLIESGKIAVDTMNLKSKYLEVEFISDSIHGSKFLGTFSQRSVEMDSKNKLNLISGCCDAYDHHFERVK